MFAKIVLIFSVRKDAAENADSSHVCTSISYQSTNTTLVQTCPPQKVQMHLQKAQTAKVYCIHFWILPVSVGEGCDVRKSSSYCRTDYEYSYDRLRVSCDRYC